MKVPYLDEELVRKLLDWDSLIGAMEAALADFSAGEVLQPVRQMLRAEAYGGVLGIMPAISKGIGVKLVCFYPGNAELGLDTHMAVIALFREETGEPLAILDGRLITEMRTAAVSAVATRLLADPAARSLALLGSGVQAASHLAALRYVMDVEDVRVWSRTEANALRFAERHGARAATAEEAVRGADVVVTVTSASEPVLRGRWLKPGAHVNAVGACLPDWRELDDDVMSNVIIVDSREGALAESGDVILSGARIEAELGQVIVGSATIDRSRTTVFKSLGMAVEDLAAAKLVYEKSR